MWGGWGCGFPGSSGWHSRRVPWIRVRRKIGGLRQCRSFNAAPRAGRDICEQRGQWGGAKLIPRLHDRGIADAAAPAAARGQHEIEMVDDLGNAAIVEQA